MAPAAFIFWGGAGAMAVNLRYFLEREPGAVTAALHIVLRVVEAR
jgi:hypothetical protein